MTDHNYDSSCLAARPVFFSSFGRGNRLLAILAAVALLCSSTGVQFANAATIPYGDLEGDTVVYTNVTESSITDPVPLYMGPGETPVVSGDSITFNPTGFGAFGQDGALDLTDGQLTFGVEGKPLFAITNINFSEQGTWDLIGNGTDATYVDVTASGVINIFEVDGVGINPVMVPLEFTFAPNADGKFELVTDGAVARNWSGGQFVDLNQALTDAGVSFLFGATRIGVNLDNRLVAVSESGTAAFINKSAFGGLSVSVNIPEPTSMLLAGLGMIGLVVVGGGRRRVL